MLAGWSATWPLRRELMAGVTPYDLRHSATSLLSEVGVPPEMLADLLGHVDTRMVHRFYRHPVSPTIRVAAEHIDTALDL
jgi:integrase